MIVDMLPASNLDVAALDPSEVVARAFEHVSPAVVSITGRTADGRPAGHGSGVLYTPDGYALTNSHVANSAPQLSASLTDGREVRATGSASTDFE